MDIVFGQGGSCQMCYDEPLVPNDVLVELGIPGVKGYSVLCGIKMMTRSTSRVQYTEYFGVLRTP